MNGSIDDEKQFRIENGYDQIAKVLIAKPPRATNTEGHQGTVHGAIASGLRAAREILSHG